MYQHSWCPFYDGTWQTHPVSVGFFFVCLFLVFFVFFFWETLPCHTHHHNLQSKWSSLLNVKTTQPWCFVYNILFSGIVRKHNEGCIKQSQQCLSCFKRLIPVVALPQFSAEVVPCTGERNLVVLLRIHSANPASKNCLKSNPLLFRILRIF